MTTDMDEEKNYKNIKLLYLLFRKSMADYMRQEKNLQNNQSLDIKYIIQDEALSEIKSGTGTISGETGDDSFDSFLGVPDNKQKRNQVLHSSLNESTACNTRAGDG